MAPSVMPGDAVPGRPSPLAERLDRRRHAEHALPPLLGDQDTVILR